MTGDSPTAAHQRYRNKNGSIVPGVTTVIGLLAKPALVGWAWKLGMSGEDMNKVRDMACDIGTATHYIIVECRLLGKEPDLQHFTPYVVEAAKKMEPAFLKYLKDHPSKLVASEKQLVSERWQYGGALDWVCIPKETGLVTLRDIKTSKGIYDEYKIQLAAYQEMWNENYPDNPIQAVEAIHLDKTDGTCTVHPFGNLSTEFEIFKHLRAVYMLQKKADPGRNRQTSGYRKASKLGGAV
jgi:hypothetical protein